MARGIHLKHLKTTDLTALGVEGERIPPTDDPASLATRLEETDPVLSRVVSEVREGLEGTLQLLEEALEERAPRRETGVDV